MTKPIPPRLEHADMKELYKTIRKVEEILQAIVEIDVARGTAGASLCELAEIAADLLKESPQVIDLEHAFYHREELEIADADEA